MKHIHLKRSFIRYKSPIGRFYEAYTQLSSFFKEKNTNPLILDAGCGFGELELFIKTVGCDIDSQALRYAKRLCKNESRFVSASLLHLPFQDETFSAVVILDVLEHIRNEVNVLRESLRVLRPNGLIVVTVPLEMGIANIFDINYFRMQHKHYNRHELLALLENLGFGKASFSRRGSILENFLGLLTAFLDKVNYVAGAYFRIATESLNHLLHEHGPLRSQLVISAIKSE